MKNQEMFYYKVGMAEIYNGPLDIVRRVNADAVALDELLMWQADDFRAGGAHDPKELIDELDARHPLMNQEVTAHGSVLMIDAKADDEPGEAQLQIVDDAVGLPTSECVSPKGIYFGFAVKPVYYPDLDMTFQRVVHMIKTGEHTFNDQFHDFHRITNFTYVCVDGAELAPSLPVNAHSLEDLKNDSFLKECDMLVFARDKTVALIKTIAGMTNTMLRKMEHMQRISYLNSLGLLDGVKLLTRDIVIIDDEMASMTNALYSDMSCVVTIPPTGLAISYRYTRLESGEIMSGGPPEVSARAELEDGKTALVPLRNIIGITQE